MCGFSRRKVYHRRGPWVAKREKPLVSWPRGAERAARGGLRACYHPAHVGEEGGDPMRDRIVEDRSDGGISESEPSPGTAGE